MPAAEQAVVADGRRRHVTMASITRVLSHLLIAAAAAGFVLTAVRVQRAPPGTFAALGLMYGAAYFVAPLVVGSLVCALHSYLAVIRPRGCIRLLEVISFFVVGLALLTPGALVLGLVLLA